MQKLAEISINYIPNLKHSEMPLISCSSDCETLFRSIWSEKIYHCEEFLIMLLNRANRVLGYSKISVGGMAGTVCDPKIIFQAALKANASSIILAHNHPSGNAKPSSADLDITKKLKSGGQLLDMPVLDHIILTGESFFSFADDGLM